ncbi:hypothetical protein [Streptomyces sannanensis]
MTTTDQARAVLEDPRFLVPEAPAGGAAPGTMRWLRQSVARFGNGAVHRRRRALAEAELARLDETVLRDRARELARTTAPDLAPYVPVAVLAEALGARGEIVPAVRAVAAAYQPGASDTAMARADDGVATLMAGLPEGEPETVANLIGLLVQTCDATAALIVNARRQGGSSAEEATALALRHDPPVRATRRTAARGAVLDGCPVAEGTEVPVDLTGGLAFGHGIRPCPGSRCALALAHGVLDVLLEESR